MVKNLIMIGKVEDIRRNLAILKETYGSLSLSNIIGDNKAMIINDCEVYTKCED